MPSRGFTSLFFLLFLLPVALADVWQDVQFTRTLLKSAASIPNGRYQLKNVGTGKVVSFVRQNDLPNLHLGASKHSASSGAFELSSGSGKLVRIATTSADDGNSKCFSAQWDQHIEGGCDHAATMYACCFKEGCHKAESYGAMNLDKQAWLFVRADAPIIKSIMPKKKSGGKKHKSHKKKSRKHKKKKHSKKHKKSKKHHKRDDELVPEETAVTEDTVAAQQLVGDQTVDELTVENWEEGEPEIEELVSADGEDSEEDDDEDEDEDDEDDSEEETEVETAGQAGLVADDTSSDETDATIQHLELAKRGKKKHHKKAKKHHKKKGKKHHKKKGKKHGKKKGHKHVSKPKKLSANTKFFIIAVDHIFDMRTRAISGQTKRTAGGWNSLILNRLNAGDKHQQWVLRRVR